MDNNIEFLQTNLVLRKFDSVLAETNDDKELKNILLNMF